MNENKITPETPLESVKPSTGSNLHQPTVDLSNIDADEKDNLITAIPASVMQLSGPLIQHLPFDMSDKHKRALILLASHVPHKDIAEVLNCSESLINQLSVRHKDIITRLRTETIHVMQHVVSNIVSVGLDKLYHSVLSWEGKLTPAQTSQAVNALSGLVRMTTELTQAADKTGNNPSGLPSPRSIAQLDNALNKVRGLKA